MKFGVSLHPNWPEGVTQESVLRRCSDDIVTAEKLGYYSAWVTEHHFAADPTYKPFGLEGPFPAYDLISDPLTFLMHPAARTEKIKLGTGVLILHYDDPIRMAEKAALLDVLSGGRVQLGLGRGGGVKEPKAFKVPPDPQDNTDKYFEAIDVMTKAWSGESFKHEGKFFQYPEVIVVPKPLQKQIPCFLSNRNERAIKYAAEHNMSYAAVTSAWGSQGIDSHNAFHEKFVELQTAAGYDPNDKLYPQVLYCFIAPTDREAEDMAYESIQRRDAFAEAHYEARRDKGGTFSPLDVPVAHQAKRVSFDSQFKGQLETNMIGSPKNCAEKLRALLDKIPSFNLPIMLMGTGCPPVEFDRRSMRLFAEEIMPKFADR